METNIITFTPQHLNKKSYYKLLHNKMAVYDITLQDIMPKHRAKVPHPMIKACSVVFSNDGKNKLLVYNKPDHNHRVCVECGWPIAEGHTLCGECAVEDDCGY